MNIHPVAYLRTIHILAASFWVGGAFLNAFFLIPSIASAGPAGGQVMREIAQVRKLPVFMNSVMVVVLLSGLWLYGRDSSGFQMAWIASGTGMTFTFGALCALATGAVGHFVIIPTVKKIGALAVAAGAAGGPPNPERAAEMAALQCRILKASRAVAFLLVAATIAMAMARFV